MASRLIARLTVALAIINGPAAAHPIPAAGAAPDNAASGVRIGLDGPQEDGCGGIGRILTGTYGSDDTLAVYDDSGADRTRTDQLPNGMLVWLCEAQGEWQGIVYPSGAFQELGDCRVSTPQSEPRRYDGPCKSGWVEASNIVLTAN